MELEALYIEKITGWSNGFGSIALGLFLCLEKEVLRENSGAKMLYEEFQRVKEQAQPGPRLELDAAHVFCQWQSCLQMGVYLNQLLSTPLPEPDLTR